MNEKELQFILQEGEGLKVEFKESFDPKSLAKEMVAFANSIGGIILLGVADKGNIIGIKITNTLKSQIQDVARNCDPSLKIRLQEYKEVLMVLVEEGKDKPYKCSEGFFIREGANSQKLSRNEILNLVVGLGKVNFDTLINERFVFPKDFDSSKFQEFLRRSGLTRTVSIPEMLRMLSLGDLDQGKLRLNNAAVLFFGKRLGQFFRQNFITCVLYKGKERVQIIDRKDFTDDVLSNYEEGINFLKRHLRLEYIIEGSGPRKEVLELPEEALRETLLNAIVHRDYFDETFGIFVELFDDRVEITNRGKLLFDKKKLGTMSVIRNPLLFDLFYRLDLIEKVGSGINRIKRFTRERSLKVKFEVDDFFRVVFYKSRVMGQPEPLNDSLNDSLTERQREILSMVSVEKLNITALMTKLGISRKTVQREIIYLQENGLLYRVGSKKSGYYALVNKKINKAN